MNYIDHKKIVHSDEAERNGKREREEDGKKMEKAQSQHSMETPPPNATSSNIQ